MTQYDSYHVTGMPAKVPAEAVGQREGRPGGHLTPGR